MRQKENFLQVLGVLIDKFEKMELSDILFKDNGKRIELIFKSRLH